MPPSAQRQLALAAAKLYLPGAKSYALARCKQRPLQRLAAAVCLLLLLWGSKQLEERQPRA